MKILGIIAEYDPFHNGHARHLRLAREAVQPDFTFVVLSGPMKQRGELALLSPYDRARCALAAGADAVFALPVAWTARPAEQYALGAVAMLQRLGATHLAFGAETEDLRLLQRVALELEESEDGFSDTLREGLNQGMGYPQAVAEAMRQVDPAAAGVLQSPNNILAICYLRAMLRSGAKMKPVVIPRMGAYHAETIDPEQPSASALRAAFSRGAWSLGYAGVPEETRRVLRRAFLEGKTPRQEVYDYLLLSRLRGMTHAEASGLPDASEGLGDRLLAAARQATTLRQLLDEVSGKRYPRARISRICAWALLGGTEEALREAPLPERAVLLGLRKNPEMTALWRESAMDISTRWTEEPDLAAWRLWAQCANQPDTLPWTEKVISM